MRPSRPRVANRWVHLLRSSTNQAVIDAFVAAAVDLGLSSRYSLLKKAGLSVSVLAMNRAGPYRGAAIQDLPNLTDAERQLVLRKLAATPPRGGSEASTDAPAAAAQVALEHLAAPAAEGRPGSSLTPILLVGAALALLLAGCGICMLTLSLAAMVGMI